MPNLIELLKAKIGLRKIRKSGYNPKEFHNIVVVVLDNGHVKYRQAEWFADDMTGGTMTSVRRWKIVNSMVQEQLHKALREEKKRRS